MNREKAADLLDNLVGMIEDNQSNDYDEALKLAIKALEQEKCKQDKKDCNNCKYNNKSHLDEPCHTCFYTEEETPTAWEALEQPDWEELKLKTKLNDDELFVFLYLIFKHIQSWKDDGEV